LLLVGVTIAAGVVEMMQREARPGWSILSRVVLIAMVASWLSALLSPSIMTEPNAGTLAWLFAAYVVTAGLAALHLVLQRFDEAVGRAP
jgi:hypothetical protein